MSSYIHKRWVRITPNMSWGSPPNMVKGEGTHFMIINSYYHLVIYRSHGKSPVSCFLDVSPSQLLRKWPEIQCLIESRGGSLPPMASHCHGQGLGA